MNKEKIKSLIPLALIVGGLTYTAIIVSTSDIVLSKGHWAAYGLTSVVLIAYFFNRKISDIILGITLFLGLFNLLKFTPTTYTIGGGLAISGSEFTIAIQLFSLVASAVFFYNYRRPIKNWFSKDGI